MKLLKRIIVAIIWIPIILFIFYKGNLTFIAFLSALSIIMFHELRKMFLAKGIKIPLITFLINTAFFLLLLKFGYYIFFPTFLILIIIIGGNDIIRGKQEGSAARLAFSIFALLYVNFLLASVYFLRELENGNILLISLIALIWVTDSAAYFIGKKFGKHRGLIQASPNKSLEGFLAGFFAAALFSAAGFYWEVIPLKAAIILTIAVGIFGQFGDIVESMLKRDTGIKDSSNFLPGHGGILDRFDSLLIAAPVLYLLLKFF